MIVAVPKPKVTVTVTKPVAKSVVKTRGMNVPTNQATTTLRGASTVAKLSPRHPVKGTVSSTVKVVSKADVKVTRPTLAINATSPRKPVTPAASPAISRSPRPQFGATEKTPVTVRKTGTQGVTTPSSIKPCRLRTPVIAPLKARTIVSTVSNNDKKTAPATRPPATITKPKFPTSLPRKPVGSVKTFVPYSPRTPGSLRKVTPLGNTVVEAVREERLSTGLISPPSSPIPVAEEEKTDEVTTVKIEVEEKQEEQSIVYEGPLTPSETFEGPVCKDEVRQSVLEQEPTTNDVPSNKPRYITRTADVAATLANLFKTVSVTDRLRKPSPSRYQIPVSPVGSDRSVVDRLSLQQFSEDGKSTLTGKGKTSTLTQVQCTAPYPDLRTRLPDIPHITPYAGNHNLLKGACISTQGAQCSFPCPDSKNRIHIPPFSKKYVGDMDSTQRNSKVVDTIFGPRLVQMGGVPEYNIETQLRRLSEQGRRVERELARVRGTRKVSEL